MAPRRDKEEADRASRALQALNNDQLREAQARYAFVAMGKDAEGSVLAAMGRVDLVTGEPEACLMHLEAVGTAGSRARTLRFVGREALNALAALVHDLVDDLDRLDEEGADA